MKTKSFETILFSTVGVVAMLFILVAFNVISAHLKTRVDLTKEKAYTLSVGTKEILRKLDTPVKIRFYASQPEQASPETVMLKTYAKRVEDLLGEFKQVAGDKLVIEKLDPQPDSDAEDSARLDGVEGQMLRSGEPFYLGLAVSLLDSKEVMPLPPNEERLLEYKITRAITRVTKPEKPAVGVMSGLPVFGMPSNPMMQRMGQRGQEPWVFVSELKNDFTVKNVEMTADKIDDDIKVLIVIHPKQISDAAQFALDQFVLRGGKLIAFLDAFSLVDSQGQENPMMGQMGGGSSSLEKLFKVWGLQFEMGKVVADLNFKAQSQGRGGRPVDVPAALVMTAEGINSDDIATSGIDNVLIPFGGAFTGTPAAGLKETVLLHSTKDSQLVEGFLANLSSEQIMKEFKASGTEYALALKLSGKFKTAFPDGKPAEKKDEPPDAEKKPDEKKDEKKPDSSLKESAVENTVVLFGDSDFLYDNFVVRKMETPFGNFVEPLNANLALAQNIVEQLSGDQSLINMRSRASVRRPFTLVKKMQTEAEERYRSKIKGLEDSLQATQQKVNELQAKKEGGQKFILSPEQQAELEKFRKEQANVNKELKQVRKDFSRDITSLENRLKWVNIAAMPLAVTISGILIALLKRKRTSAK